MLGVPSMFSFLLPPSSLYFASQSNIVSQGVFGKVKNINLGRSVEETQAEFGSKKDSSAPGLRMNENRPYLPLIPTNPLLSC